MAMAMGPRVVVEADWKPSSCEGFEFALLLLWAHAIQPGDSRAAAFESNGAVTTGLESGVNELHGREFPDAVALMCSCTVSTQV